MNNKKITIIVTITTILIGICTYSYLFNILSQTSIPTNEENLKGEECLVSKLTVGKEPIESQKNYILGTWLSTEINSDQKVEQKLILTPNTYTLNITTTLFEDGEIHKANAIGTWEYKGKFLDLMPKTITENNNSVSQNNMIVRRRINIAKPRHNGRMITHALNRKEKVIWKLKSKEK